MEGVVGDEQRPHNVGMKRWDHESTDQRGYFSWSAHVCHAGDFAARLESGKLNASMICSSFVQIVIEDVENASIDCK